MVRARLRCLGVLRGRRGAGPPHARHPGRGRARPGAPGQGHARAEAAARGGMADAQCLYARHCGTPEPQAAPAGSAAAALLPPPPVAPEPVPARDLLWEVRPVERLPRASLAAGAGARATRVA
ncbi:hypothetical protein LP420_18305 [Massilia sp. B-10]|nr:hypothetical protein LP420_18305 [Massilia sp. B-10]